MAQTFQGRGYVERANLVTNAALAVGGANTIFSKEFPMGEGWYMMNIRIGIILVVGTGTTAIAEGELLFIKNVLLKTDRGEILCNLPGRALYKITTYQNSCAPNKDAVAASNGTYYVNLPIHFADPKMIRMEDSVLDTSRYNSVTLQITLGSVADLLGTVGTATVTATGTIEVERSLGALPPEAKPHYHISYDYRPPIDASVLTTIDIERSADMAIKRLYVHSCTSGTAGVPFAGVNSDAVQATITIKDQNRFIEKERVHRMIQEHNKNAAFLEALIAGVEVFDFVMDGSVPSALATGNKSVLQYTWINQAGVTSGYIVTLVEEMLRTLK
jgi:hypothetical protein